MDNHRVDRFCSILKKNIADIFMFEINNPKLKKASIIDVIISQDLKNAKIVLSNIQTPKEEELVEELNKTKGFIRKLLSQKMYLKHVPNLKFIIGSEQIKQEKENK